ncbi:hypothetical protein [Planctomicrobium sp. SH664]|uniref:hypothetical protein n=1 Tax=Planctomicrobium sp. SH664 TaxID=3448125 RepID=UPI003F5AF4EA
MTSSIASSAASASGNNLQRGGYFIGMDEAGYGPNLGPLLLTVTKWKTPAEPGACPFYRLLKGAVEAVATKKGKLHLADSKIVFTGKDGFRSLERSALALLRCLGWQPASLHELWTQLVGSESSPSGAAILPPWYEKDQQLPVAATPEEVEAASEQLLRCMEKCGVELLEVHSDVVVEPRFNRLTEEHGSKGLMLSRLAFQLLRRTWSPDDSTPTVFVGDKHGGRNRYDELLSEVLDGQMIFRVEEKREISRYRVGSTELRFQMQGEQHLPVACASIVSKYVRELAMDLFNDFWLGKCPDVKPTRGYPNDARRFRELVEPTRIALNVAEHDFWRAR